MQRALPGLVAAAFLAACGADQTFDPQAEVDAARFVAGPPPSVTLITVVNTSNGSGAHSGLLINGSERVLFDPAGTWSHPSVPVQHDVHFGMTDRMVNFYLDYHTREIFDVIEHRLVVSPETAALVMARARGYGAVPKAQCANSISDILRGVPGFESIESTWFPKRLGASFARLPGVQERYLREVDTPDTHGVTLVDSRGNLVN
jgi:hypothetical protein